MSSYCVDPKTNLPLLYLKDNKKAFWQKFKAIYPDGIKRTSFMARLESGRYVYRQDLVDYVIFVMNTAMKYLIR